MANFKTRINQISKKNGKIILANDYDVSTPKITTKTIQNIKKFNKFLCGLKINFHLLLPLGVKEISRITKTAHHYGIQTIADIKLNDIGNTNRITAETLWNMGFDAIIINPIMGESSLKNIISSSHKKNKGVIALCHMSSPEAKLSYDLKIKLENNKQYRLYQLFLDWAILHKADGIIVGATFPDIIKYCKKQTGKKLNVYSPGVGTQGGKVNEVMSAGSDYLIIGRTILNSKNPTKTVEELSLQSLGK